VLAEPQSLVRCTYITDTPSNSALLGRSSTLVGLALNAEIHNVISADGTVVDHDIPGPQGNGVPLSDTLVKTPA
jgi:hypothetical protein